MTSKKKEMSARDENRRDFMKGTVGVLVAGATLGGIPGEAHAQSANQKAVLPDGRAYSRGELLQRLGLDPNTPPEAWITIGCVINSAALKLRDAERLVESGKLDRKQLTTQQQQGLKIKPSTLDAKGVKILDSNQVERLGTKGLQR